MRLLYVCDHIFQVSGGLAYSQQLPYAVLRRYLEVFSSVTVVARSVDAGETGQTPLASGDGVEFVFLESIASLKSYFGLRRRHRLLIRHLLDGHDGVIGKVPGELALLAASVAQDMNRHYALEVVGCGWDALWNYGEISAKLYAPTYFLKMKQCIRNAGSLLYVTDGFLQRRYPGRLGIDVHVASNVNLPKIGESVLQTRIDRLRSQRKILRIGTIASLKTRYKGIHVALNALALLDKERTNFEYHVVGAGDSTPYSLLARELGIDDRVYFHGGLTRDSVLDWLDDIDIYIQPSLTEGLPRALIEAMSRGCPSIGSNRGGIPELLDFAMTFDPGDPSCLSKILLSLSEDTSALESEAERNFTNAQRYQSELLGVRRKRFITEYVSGI